MKKLTLEKAREILEFLQGKAAEGDITLAQENYLQAMELAVIALEIRAVTSLTVDFSALTMDQVDEFIALSQKATCGHLEFNSALPLIPDRVMLRKLVDLVWNEAKESTEVPSTKFADQLIDTVFPISTAKPEAL
ncbi:UNVERIFIED_ORG: hypothetical protein M2414_002384 [Rahnella aquatilis]